VIRVAAIADLHFSHAAAGTLRPDLEGIAEVADSLLLAGDLTRVGLAFHGHAHNGREKGLTPGGVRVRNVVYGQSNGLHIPDGAVRVLFDHVYGRGSAGDRPAEAES
jgi:hypothetical protein